MTRKPTPPTYDRYRDRYARVVINRKSIHLGAYGSDKSYQKYRELLAEWSAGKESEGPGADDTLTMAVMLEGYRKYAKAYYGEDRDGRYRHLLPTIKTVRELFADLPVLEFGPKKLKTLRQAFVDLGHTRGHVNACVQRVVGMFRWAASEELIPGTIVHSLESVTPLRHGHTSAPEGKTVVSVPQSDVDATLPHLPPVVADMVQLQLIAGCRPGELCRMTPSQIDRSGDVWFYRPAKHKNTHRGHVRIVALGPRAQMILSRYLLRPADSYCFSPKESLAQFYDRQHERRTTPMNCGNKPSAAKRQRAIDKVSDHYTVASYRRAIERACDRADIARWTPHRLRHTAGTVVREQFGLDASQAILGNKHARVAEIYSELSMAKAAEVARQIG